MAGVEQGIVVIGSCVIDVTAYAERFPLAGETLVASGIETRVGGKASNQAIGISRLGASPYLIVKLGNDEWAQRALSRSSPATTTPNPQDALEGWSKHRRGCARAAMA